MPAVLQPITDIEVTGVGMHPFGRFPDRSLKDLARVAILNALADSGLTVRDIDAVYSSNAMAGLLQGQEQIRGQSVLREVGIERVPVVNVENACAGGSTAVRQAVLALQAGAAERVLVVGFEKMFVGDLDRSLNALESAADLDVIGGLGLQFTGVYAMKLRKRIAAGDLDVDDLVQATVKNHMNGSRNPNAQHRQPLSAEEIAASRPIADPLTLLMCSSMSDGAAAVVLARAGAVEHDRPVIRVRAAQGASGFTRTSDDEPTLAAGCAAAAYEQAGIGPDEVDLAEAHDAMAPGELLYYEELGFCEKGGARELLRSGATTLDGRIPFNTSGGLSSRGHPVGATGVAQVAEVVWQLRGEAGERQVERPRWGMAQNSGGWLEGESAAGNVHLFERVTAWA